MNKVFRQGAILLIAGSLMVAQESFAAKGWVTNALITKVQASNDGKWGECMAFLTKRNSSLDCSNWVTFDCAGDVEGNTKAAGNAKYNTAQLALVTGNRSQVFLNDSIKINGQCFAERIQVLNR